jgi:ATP-binding cassette subfamily B protein
MHWPHLQRACRFVRWPTGAVAVLVASVGSAVLVPALIVILGLVSEILVTRTAPTGESVPLVGPALCHLLRIGLAPGVGELWLAWLLALGLSAAVLESVMLFLHYRALHAAAWNVTTALKGALVGQAFRRGIMDLIGTRRGRTQELFNEQAEAVRVGLAAWWRAVPRAPATLVLLVALALLADFRITLAVSIFALLTWLVYGWMRGRAREQSRLWTDRAALEHAKLDAHLRQVPLVAGYALETPPGEPLESSLRRFEDAARRASWAGTAVAPAVLLIVLAGTTLMLLMVGLRILVDPPDFSVAGTVVLGAALLTAYFPFARLARLADVLNEADRAAGEIFAYLDREPVVSEVPAARELGALEKGITFDNVTLADRSGAKLIDGGRLEIPARQRVALVASDSRVPPALAGLLARFYDPAAGRVLYDGVDLRQATLASLRSRIALVTADGMLFTGTVADNISCGDSKYTSLDVSDAAKEARAYNFIQQLPQGFSTVIGEHGTRLDAGQAFRIGLARAVLRRPSLLIVQEPNGDIDETSAGHIDEALRRLGSTCTLVILPARNETLRTADRIYVFDGGSVRAVGTHAELLQSDELYRHVNYVRFNAFRDRVR